MIENKEIFQELFNVLESNNIDIERETNYENSVWSLLNSPDVREGWYNGVEGFYFNKSDYGFFDQEQVKALFPIQIQDKTIELVDVSDMEVDDDRMWKSSISFIIK
jgi:hypothetical protein